jgi:uncharacterized protein (TIGR02001 family)
MHSDGAFAASRRGRCPNPKPASRPSGARAVERAAGMGNAIAKSSIDKIHPSGAEKTMHRLFAKAALPLVVSCLALTAPLQAGAQDKKADSPHTVTGNINLVTDYRFRGISQTNAKPAVQGGFDWAHTTGVYAGVWGSNVSWLSDGGAGRVSSSLELDIYGGYKFKGAGLDWDVGLLQYWYPGRYPGGFTNPNTTEVYGAGTWKQYTFKLSYSLTNAFGFAGSRGSIYLDGTGNFDLGDGFNLIGHLGYQRIDGGSGRSTSACSYADYKVGVTKEYFGLTGAAALVGTNAKGGRGECYRNAFDRDLGRATIVLSVGKTF